MGEVVFKGGTSLSIDGGDFGQASPELLVEVNAFTKPAVELNIMKGVNNSKNKSVFKNNNTYYIGDLYAGAMCKQDDVYFLSTPLKTGSYFKIKLNKHSLKDFSEIYSTEILFTKSEGQKYRYFHVGYRNISIENGMLILELLPDMGNYNAIVKVQLPENRDRK